MRKNVPIVICDRKHSTGPREREAAGTLEIVLGADRATLDLCPECLRAAKQDLRGYIAVSIVTSPAKTTPASVRQRSAAIRTWAEGEGMYVPARGRIPASVHEAWDAAGRPGTRP